ncbi:hypothetical protein BDA96_01G211400 [Sorghum bicolor]|uniref:F-box domain-containing protein n=2 Tax=Sorghum bicolor TaxID=4558 RepID=A0A921RZA4_SORBI|nr:uncharacterized protein LOC8065184 [Sorghum bicolor]KAG0548942.1 hypothetical protein BDA96_01G211400 [Sorghum bicolor]KXG38204.1 hypothetical protein SORBI_3001G198500 [Sorghum bicolor]|eukprot:XP_021306039.1 uncharacterized protein LOC8065184 [Sorghum bicolor]
MATPPPPPKLQCGRSLLDLPDELIPEILLRLPPHDPRRLVRCSAVCKPWRRLLTDPAFLRRYRAFHGVPPMLGLIFYLELPRSRFLARFVRTTSFRPRTLDHAGCYVRDARHGRVLFSNATSEENEDELFVWSPVTGERWGLDMPSPFDCWSVAVLCAAAAREGGCDCDHLDCHGGPFLVTFVDTDDDGRTYARVYSSETGAWSDATYAQHPNNLAMDMKDPSALVGNRIYFPAAGSKTIVEYDLGRRKLAFVDPPLAHQGHGILMPAMGGGLGFASVRGSRLYLWSRETGSARTAAAWTPSRVLELNTLPNRRTRVPLNQPTALGFTEILMEEYVTVVGFAEGLGVIFVRTSAGVFAINLESGQVKKMSSRRPGVVIPYMSFYTPDHATGLPPVP